MNCHGEKHALAEAGWYQCTFLKPLNKTDGTFSPLIFVIFFKKMPFPPKSHAYKLLCLPDNWVCFFLLN